jgi:hypothetical protein
MIPSQASHQSRDSEAQLRAISHCHYHPYTEGILITTSDVPKADLPVITHIMCPFWLTADIWGWLILGVDTLSVIQSSDHWPCGRRTLDSGLIIARDFPTTLWSLLGLTKSLGIPLSPITHMGDNNLIIWEIESRFGVGWSCLGKADPLLPFAHLNNDASVNDTEQKRTGHLSSRL